MIIPFEARKSIRGKIKSPVTSPTGTSAHQAPRFAAKDGGAEGAVFLLTFFGGKKSKISDAVGIVEA